MQDGRESYCAYTSPYVMISKWQYHTALEKEKCALTSGTRRYKTSTYSPRNAICLS
jgi:hypothetical protein